MKSVFSFMVLKNHKIKSSFRITIFLLKFLSTIDTTVVRGEWSLTYVSRIIVYDFRKLRVHILRVNQMEKMEEAGFYAFG